MRHPSLGLLLVVLLFAPFLSARPTVPVSAEPTVEELSRLVLSWAHDGDCIGYTLECRIFEAPWYASPWFTLEDAIMSDARQFESWVVFPRPQEFRLRAEAVAGSSPWSNVVKFDPKLPTITSELSDRTVRVGETVTLSLETKYTNEVADLRYEWFKDHQLVAHAPTLILPCVTQQDTGSYYLVLRSGVDTFAISRPVQVIVSSPDASTAPPPPPTLHDVSVVAEGDWYAPRFRWAHAGDVTGFSVRFMMGDSGVWADVRHPFAGNGGLARDFIIPAGSVFHFRVRANSQHGPSAWSNVRSVQGPTKVPHITSPLVARTVARDARAVFTVAATSSSPLTYEWYRDDQKISGATKSSLIIRSAQPTDAGSYRVIVSNAQGVSFSGPVRLYVVDTSSYPGRRKAPAGPRHGPHALTAGRP
jgi:hypothetical protein